LAGRRGSLVNSAVCAGRTAPASCLRPELCPERHLPLRGILRDYNHRTNQGPFPALSEPQPSPVSPCQEKSETWCPAFLFCEHGARAPAGERTAGPRKAGARSAGLRRAGPRRAGATRGRCELYRARAAREQGASNTRAIRDRSCSRGRADGRFIECLKSFIFAGHQFWASLSQKLSQSTVWASFLTKKKIFWVGDCQSVETTTLEIDRFQFMSDALESRCH
jgi:hypothetical protein